MKLAIVLILVAAMIVPALAVIRIRLRRGRP